jgi:epoxyqueuosine reductase
MRQESPNDVFSLTQAVKAEALRLGFHLVGVTTPETPPHLAAFENWLAAGRHGKMTYLAEERSRQRRSNPLAILPECRSILVLGVCYPPPLSEPAEPERLISRIASYARGMDYHDVLPHKLKALVAFIETALGRKVPNRWYTDTGPLLERDLAQRAGLGWIGKNTCLINPALGSFFFLAEILLGIELAVDQPFQQDLCGTCRRCLEACPTGCILPDRTLDARKCISYLTIELKGAVPLDLRPLLGEWVFGCDVCQQVCPWNVRFASHEFEPSFSPIPVLSQIKLEQAMLLSPQDFNRLFRGSPVKRAKRRGFLRNVAIALGNRGDPRALPMLTGALLHDTDPLVRGHAAWALSRIGSEDARLALRQAASIEEDVAVQEEIRRAIS